MKACYKACLIIILLTCFCFQVWDGFIKFVKRQTTIVTKKTVPETIRLPAISFCPGFKDRSRDYYDRSEELGELLDDDDSLTPMEMWLSDTYEIEELIDSIRAPGPWHLKPQVRPNATGFYTDLNITLHELSTGYGRCYAIHFSPYLITNAEDFFTIKFNMTHHAELFLYIHEDYNEVGQHWGYYPIMPTQVIIARNGHYTIDIQKNLFKPYDNKGCRKEDDYSYPSCVVNWARKRYLHLFEEDNRTACWIPDTQYYALYSGLKECQTKEMADWTRSETYTYLSENLGEIETTGCARRCVRNSLEVLNVREPDVSDGFNSEESAAFMYYSAIFESDEFEEVVLYDFNNIIAAIGGSLGLFLGVSVFSIVMYISNRCSHLTKLELDKVKSNKEVSLHQIKVTS